MSDDLHPLPPTRDTRFSDWLDELPRDRHSQIAKAAPLLAPLFSSAPYLFELARKHTGFLGQMLQEDPRFRLDNILDELEALGRHETDEAEFSKHLRLAKGRVALMAAIAETGKVWSTEQATAALGDLAAARIRKSRQASTLLSARVGTLAMDESDVEAANFGLAIFALGKHGGRELNYSSDIDVVAFYDPAAGVLADPQEASKFYSRIIQRLAALMQERSEFGYVFRTDLRLRPDPGSTPPALSVDAALTYYEGRGQNWERAAWIKARQCAGDRRVGDMFLKSLAPFIWRKHLDFAAIADIQAMKRQINIARNVGGQRLGGHNVKLGRGGIREIEFFTQTQQLIAGGREPALRVRPTSKALAVLAQSHWISTKTAKELTKTYWFLRAVENRLQMINDEQTHTLPETDAGLATIARLLGYAARDEFETDYRAALDIVTANYNNLFVLENALSLASGSLVFTGTDDDPATLETLSLLGFENPARASAIIRNWHYGRYAATRAAAARARLTELLPLLLETISRAGNADEALARFDDFLSRLPVGVQLFSLLCAHGQLLDLLIAFMASAPRMADAVVRRAHVVDGLIDPARSGEAVDPEILIAKIDSFLGEARAFEDVIERARIIGQEQLFLISAGLISATISPLQAGRQYAALAQTLLDRLFRSVRETFEQRHGKVAGARTALLAFGKLGSREMSVTSDLDVVLLYDAPAKSEMSDGQKPLATSHYFTRLTQRLIAAISAPTAEGVLYEVDMRLRPSGNAGPLATSLKAFFQYQRDKAWAWEHMALTRARVIFADPGFGKQVEQAVSRIILRPRDKRKTIAEVREMRARLLRERPPRHGFDLKLVPGGLIDIEFVAQSAILLYPDSLFEQRGSVGVALVRLAELKLLPRGEELAEIHAAMSGIIQVMSVCLPDPFKDEAWTDAFRDLLAGLANYPDFTRLEADLAHMKKSVTAIANDWYRSQMEDIWP